MIKKIRWLCAVMLFLIAVLARGKSIYAENKMKLYVYDDRNKLKAITEKNKVKGLSFDDKSNTLVLNGYDGGCIFVKDYRDWTFNDVTVRLIGKNVIRNYGITSDKVDSYSIGEGMIDFGKYVDVRIKGGGSLDIYPECDKENAYKLYSIYVGSGQTLSMENVNIKIHSGVQGGINAGRIEMDSCNVYTDVQFSRNDYNSYLEEKNNENDIYLIGLCKKRCSRYGLITEIYGGIDIKNSMIGFSYENIPTDIDSDYIQYAIAAVRSNGYSYRENPEIASVTVDDSVIAFAGPDKFIYGSRKICVRDELVRYMNAAIQIPADAVKYGKDVKIIYANKLSEIPEFDMNLFDIPNVKKENKADSNNQGANTNDKKTVTNNAPVVGSVVKDKKYKYVVTKQGSDDGKTYGELKITGFKKKEYKSVKIASVVKIGNVKYKVTAIGNKAFAKCKKIKKITIGKYVKSIGKRAFNTKNKYMIKVPGSKKKAYRKMLKKIKVKFSFV